MSASVAQFDKSYTGDQWLGKLATVRKYYYTGRLVNGRVVKEYHRSGPMAELAAQAVEQRKETRRKVRARIKADREHLKVVETIMEQQ